MLTKAQTCLKQLRGHYSAPRLFPKRAPVPELEMEENRTTKRTGKAIGCDLIREGENVKEVFANSQQNTVGQISTDFQTLQFAIGNHLFLILMTLIRKNG